MSVPLAFVTGAASGIGRAAALRLADEGYRIVGFDLDAEGLERTADRVRRSGHQIEVRRLDVRDAEAVATVAGGLAVAQAPAVLANVAGVGVARTVVDTSEDEWNLVMDVNVGGVYRMCRAVVPSMLAHGGGVVVNVASVAGGVGVASRAAYCASKAAVVGLTKAMVVDHAPQGLRVVAISPGTVATEWIDKILADAEHPEATRKAMEARQLDGQMGTPEEVAAGIAFVCSPQARFINGSELVMDGGLTAQ